MILASFAAFIVIAGGLGYYLCFSPWSQLWSRFPYRVRTGKKIVALSFDDGPNGAETERIARILKKYGVRATFFQVGRNIERYPAVTRQLAADGHTIGNHSYSHAFRRYATNPGYADEIRRGQTVISNTIGREPALFRPPWLFRQPWLLRSCKKQGLTSVSGVFASAWEVFQPSGARIATAARKHVKPGTILIFHDGYNAKGANRQNTAEALEQLIPVLKAEGYDFVTVDRLLGVAPYH